jgi:hypothetical protein
MSDTAFQEKYGLARADAVAKVGSIEALSNLFDDCVSKSAEMYFMGAGGGLPSFLLFDDAMRLIDSLLTAINRITPRQGGEASEAVQQLTLLLRHAMYDDNPSIGSLRSQAANVTRKLFDTELLDCARKALGP